MSKTFHWLINAPLLFWRGGRCRRSETRRAEAPLVSIKTTKKKCEARVATDSHQSRPPSRQNVASSRPTVSKLRHRFDSSVSDHNRSASYLRSGLEARAPIPFLQDNNRAWLVQSDLVTESQMVWVNQVTAKKNRLRLVWLRQLKIEEAKMKNKVTESVLSKTKS